MATPSNAARCWRFGLFEVDAQKEELRRGGFPSRSGNNPIESSYSFWRKRGRLLLARICAVSFGRRTLSLISIIA